LRTNKTERQIVLFSVLTEKSLPESNVTFTRELLNIGPFGKVVNIETGTFKAPHPGIYFFSFTGVGHQCGGQQVNVELKHNGKVISQTFANSGPLDASSSIHLQATLKLESCDEVKLFLYSGTLKEVESCNNFTGWLLN